MPSKEQAQTTDKRKAKQPTPQFEAQTFETVDWLHQPETTVRRAAQAPPSLSPADVSRLQRAYGNRTVLRLPGVCGPLRAGGSAGPVQRQTQTEEEEEEEPLQAMPLQRQALNDEQARQAIPLTQRVGLAGGPVPPEVESAITRARGGGQPLDGAVQAQMGESMGYDFSGVRVHTDAGADKLNKQLSAKAFTTGSDIFFQRGAYAPGSSGGRELIAHELSHVVQQGTGRVSGGGSGMTVRPAGDAFEQEADELAQYAPPTAPRGRVRPSPASAARRSVAPRHADIQRLSATEPSIQSEYQSGIKGQGAFQSSVNWTELEGDSGTVIQNVVRDDSGDRYSEAWQVTGGNVVEKGSTGFNDTFRAGTLNKAKVTITGLAFFTKLPFAKLGEYGYAKSDSANHPAHGLWARDGGMPPEVGKSKESGAKAHVRSLTAEVKDNRQWYSVTEGNVTKEYDWNTGNER